MTWNFPSTKDLRERLLSTLVQAVITYMLAAQTLDKSVVKGLIAAAFVAVVNAVLIYVTSWVPTFDNWVEDTLFRTARTFVTTVLAGALVNGFDIYSMTGWRTLAISGFMAALVVLKSALAAVIAKTTNKTPITPASLATKAA